MTLWKRLFGVEDLPEERPSVPPLPEAGPAQVSEPAPDHALAALAGAERVDSDVAVAEYQSLAAQGFEARAAELLGRVIALHPELDHARMFLADALLTRGDLGGAAGYLDPLLRRPAAPTRALMIAGEIEERRGNFQNALAAYERILAHDVDYPRAKERVARLREERESRHELAGATLLTDGALARGRYRILRELGRGGAGTVFAAEDGELGRVVALKVYHRRGRAERDRLLVEARAPARLEHPGVVRVFDLDQRLGALVMEWVRGGSVRSELRKGDFDLARAVRWLVTTLESLDFVHRQGFVHRDLKPSNFLLRDDDRVVVTDFGLAARVGETASRVGAGGEGTLAYMPPEQREGAGAAPAQDVHAFGASMREILDLVPGPVPAQLFELAAACMRRDPGARPTVRDLTKEMGQ